MSELNDDRGANAAEGEGTSPVSALPHVESPSVAPDDRIEAPAEAPEPEISMPRAELESPEAAAPKPVPPLAATRGTALMLTPPRAEEAAAEPAPEPAARSFRFKLPRFAITPAVASVIAVLVGAAVGSGATAALLSLNAAPAPTPADPATFTAGLDRINRDLATLKASIDGSAKQANTQIAKIAERMDRAEKSQADTSTRLAKTAEALDRLERRLAGNGDITGSTSGAAGERTAALSDPKRPGGSAQTAILDGWVLRDVFNGAALIQTPRNGMVEVFVGDTLPGLGRIEGVKRQDGRWIVVTSRGLIVSR
jgi:hypothetical protein